MNKIKILTGLIFTLSIALALLLHNVSSKNRAKISLISTVSEYKSLTQEISKTILYLHKNKEGSSASKKLDADIERFLDKMTHHSVEFCKKDNVNGPCKDFYHSVLEFQKLQKVKTAYSSIIMDKVVKEIYNKNMKLVATCDELISREEGYIYKTIHDYRGVSYGILSVLIVLLVYLFAQFRGIMLFVQKFTRISKSILQQSTIRGLKPIKAKTDDAESAMATQNYNLLVNKINDSIEQASVSTKHTATALEKVERDIENFLDLLSRMEREESDKLTQKEDVVIDSLETVMRLEEKLLYLNKNLQQLISYVNSD